MQKHNFDHMFKYENEVWSMGFKLIAGVDEAGRGPLAGPVVAAAVALRNLQIEFPPVFDSKQLSVKHRIELRNTLINNKDLIIAIAEISPDEIDSINILNATHKAMAKALSQIHGIEFALVDGLPVKGLPCMHRAIIKGDSKSALIAAASIIAKVHRDEIMMEFAKIYPQYGFDKHKGYGTREHIAAIKKFGVSPIHRKSFEPIKNLLDLDDLFPETKI